MAPLENFTRTIAGTFNPGISWVLALEKGLELELYPSIDDDDDDDDEASVFGLVKMQEGPDNSDDDEDIDEEMAELREKMQARAQVRREL